MFRSIRYVIALIVVSVAFSGVAFAGEKLPVFVTIVPQKYFVEQIGKELVDVQVMVEPGASPHTYEPKPQQMVALSKAKLYFSIGVEFDEAKLEKLTANSNVKVIHTEKNVEKIAMAAHDEHDEIAHEEHHDGHDDQHHEHHDANHDEHEEHHQHTGLDPHIWLSPPLVKIQSQAILEALQDADPAHKDVYEANFKEFMMEIDQLDGELKNIFAGKAGMQFLVFHPSWGYFAHTYGLEQVPVEVEGKEPKPAELKELIHHANEKGIKVIFVQPQFSTKTAEIIAREIDGQVIFANPLAEDWMSNLKLVADKFNAALK